MSYYIENRLTFSHYGDILSVEKGSRSSLALLFL